MVTAMVVLSAEEACGLITARTVLQRAYNVLDTESINSGTDAYGELLSEIESAARALSGITIHLS